jgi:hypothetical protein
VFLGTYHVGGAIYVVDERCLVADSGLSTSGGGATTSAGTQRESFRLDAHHLQDFRSDEGSELFGRIRDHYGTIADQAFCVVGHAQDGFSA